MSHPIPGWSRISRKGGVVPEREREREDPALTANHWEPNKAWLADDQGYLRWTLNMNIKWQRCCECVCPGLTNQSLELESYKSSFGCFLPTAAVLVQVALRWWNTPHCCGECKQTKPSLLPKTNLWKTRIQINYLSPRHSMVKLVVVGVVVVVVLTFLFV